MDMPVWRFLCFWEEGWARCFFDHSSGDQEPSMVLFGVEATESGFGFSGAALFLTGMKTE